MITKLSIDNTDHIVFHDTRFEAGVYEWTFSLFVWRVFIPEPYQVGLDDPDPELY